MIMGGSDEAKQDHPAQKPVAPVRDPDPQPPAGRASSVYDPFLAQGTAHRRRRDASAGRCYAMEIDPRYVQVAIERWERFTGQTAVRVEP